MPTRSNSRKRAWCRKTKQTAKAALTTRERLRLEKHSEPTSRYHGLVVDLKDDKKVMGSPPKGPLHTLIRNTGLIFHPQLERWMLPLEMFAAVGFAIDEACVKELGTTCQFSRGRTQINPKRTRSSMSKQVGNSMHISCIGAFIFGALLLRPNLVDPLANPVPYETGARSSAHGTVAEASGSSVSPVSHDIEAPRAAKRLRPTGE